MAQLNMELADHVKGIKEVSLQTITILLLLCLDVILHQTVFDNNIRCPWGCGLPP